MMNISPKTGIVWVGLWLAACGAETTQDNDPSDLEPSASSQGWSLFPGAGMSGAGEPLGAEIPPDTALDCVPVGVSTVVAAGNPTQTCYFNDGDEDTLAAVVERRLEVINDTNWIHIRLTFNPDFVDNTYGQNAIGWGGDDTADAPPMAEPPMPGDPAAMKAPAKPPKGKRGHTFKDLLGSDHAEFMLKTESGDLAMHFKLDYISEGLDTASGYGSAGVTGGDGKLIVGEPEWILGATSSLARNLNGCGYGQYTTDSPATDEDYTPNDDAPDWDYRVVYEVWVAEEALAGDELQDVSIEYVHASPSKGDDTQIVTEGPCPPSEDPPVTEPPVTDPPDASTPPEVPPSEEPPADGGTGFEPPRVR
jgi:hypothetical protein